MTSKKGFTLVEMVVTIAIILILIVDEHHCRFGHVESDSKC